MTPAAAEVTARRTSRWPMLAGLVLAVICLALALRGISWRETADTIRHSDPRFLLPAFVVFTASFFVRGIRWWVILSADCPLKPLTVFWANMIGYLGNNFLPARAGEVLRSVLLGKRAGLSRMFVLATALTERMLDSVVLVILSSVALLTMSQIPSWLVRGSSIAAVVGVLGLIGLVIAPKIERYLHLLFARLPISDTICRKLEYLLAQALLGLRAFHSISRMSGFLVLTLVIWSLDGVAAVLIGDALHVGMSFPTALLLLAALGLSSAIPSTPGAVGIYQFVAVSLLVPFGIDRSAALAYSFVFQAIIYLVVGVWGTLGLWKLNASMHLPAES